jgi:hypothetical protein
MPSRRNPGQIVWNRRGPYDLLNAKHMPKPSHLSKTLQRDGHCRSRFPLILSSMITSIPQLALLAQNEHSPAILSCYDRKA